MYYPYLFQIHSLLRYVVLVALLAVIILSLTGIVNKRYFGKWDNRASLLLLIATHLQFLAGLFLYFVSPWVVFGADTMKDKNYRYWTVEHITAMLAAIVLITIARTSMKRMQGDQAKFRRLFNFNLIALAIILVMIWHSGRSLF